MSRQEIETNEYYVTMTDKFMSGWGQADGKTNKYVIGCKTYEQAEQIKRAAKERDEMKYISIHTTKPHYDKRHYIISYQSFEELGTIWTGISKEQCPKCGHQWEEKKQ